MTDHVNPKKRSEIMRAVRGKHTGPEMMVRKAAHSLGLRYRLHRPDLPGKPDLVFPKWRTAIFVHGCFWHRHSKCSKATTPKSNADFWNKKFARNVERDAEAAEMLKELGWRVLIIWQCEATSPEATATLLRKHFSNRYRP